MKRRAQWRGHVDASWVVAGGVTRAGWRMAGGVSTALPAQRSNALRIRGPSVNGLNGLSSHSLTDRYLVSIQCRLGLPDLNGHNPRRKSDGGACVPTKSSLCTGLVDSLLQRSGLIYFAEMEPGRMCGRISGGERRWSFILQVRTGLVVFNLRLLARDIIL